MRQKESGGEARTRVKTEREDERRANEIRVREETGDGWRVETRAETERRGRPGGGGGGGKNKRGEEKKPKATFTESLISVQNIRVRFGL